MIYCILWYLSALNNEKKFASYAKKKEIVLFVSFIDNSENNVYFS